MSSKVRKLSTLAVLLLLTHNALGLAIVCSDEPMTTLDAPAGNARVIWTHYDYWYSGIFAIGERLVEQAVPALKAYSDEDLVSQADGELLVAGYPAGWGMDSYLNIACVSSGADDAEAEAEVNEPALDAISTETLIL